jgi:addiction module RelE/StbE family toxin
VELRRTSQFKKLYKKLPKKAQEQFGTRLTLFLQEPQHPQLNLHKLKGEYRDYWSINVTGDYRLVFKLIEDENALLLVNIGTHSQLYG